MPSVWKPWYVFRPRQLAVRIARGLSGKPGDRVTVPMPWGSVLTVNPNETIGSSVWTTGIYDIAVSELLYRLLPIGGHALDAGANIGYMTNLMATKSGKSGTVHAFEPHPVVGQRLRDNVAALPKARTATVQVHPVALSDKPGTAKLVLPENFADNEGIGYLASDASDASAQGYDVPTMTLDGLFPSGRFDVMKMDVEGHEASVLRGATRLLHEHAIRHIVFEEHDGPASEPCKILQAAGYTLFQVGWHLRGLILADLSAPRVCKTYEAPSYLATLEPSDAVQAAKPSGWQIFGHRS